MLKQQLRTGDVLNERILDLFTTTPREHFVPPPFNAFAYSDRQLPLPHEQRMMTPLEEGCLLQALNLQGHERVLEIGTGSGFLTALLSQLCKQVISIDLFPDFTTTASKRLDEHHCHNVELITGDGANGWLDKAPYDAIVFTGAINALSDTHRLQVVPGGSLFAIIGNDAAMQGMIYTLNHQSEWHARFLFNTNLPALINPVKSNPFIF